MKLKRHPPYMTFFITLVLLLCSLESSAATKTNGFTLGVFYNPSSKPMVDAFEKELFEVQPFIRLKGWFKLRTVAVKDEFLKCHNMGKSRQVQCDNEDEIYQYGKQLSVDGILVFTDKANGGSGGSHVSVIAGTYSRQALHEFLHQIGFRDEYRYPISEYGDFMCREVSTSINVVYQDFSKLTFSSDAEARAYLADKIPWIKFIPEDIPVSHNGKIGTPDRYYSYGTIGMFRGGACDLYQPGWIPQQYSVMNHVAPLKDLITPYYASLIERALRARVMIREAPTEQVDERNQPRWKILKEWLSIQADRYVKRYREYYEIPQ